MDCMGLYINWSCDVLAFHILYLFQKSFFFCFDISYFCKLFEEMDPNKKIRDFTLDN